MIAAMIPLLVALALAAGPAAAPPGVPDSTTIAAHQASTHPMRYFVALPAGWTAERAWPVVVVVADAHRDFAGNLRRFVEARGARPYLLVAPEVVTCGGTRDQTSPPYSYTDAEWTNARSPKDFDFDDAGLAAVIAEVHAQWNGAARAYLTG